MYVQTMPDKRRDTDCSNLPKSVQQLRTKEGESLLDLHEKLVQLFIINELRSRVKLMKTQLMVVCSNADGQRFWIMCYHYEEFQIFQLAERRVTASKTEFTKSPLLLTSYGLKESKGQYEKKENILVKSYPTSGKIAAVNFDQIEQTPITSNILQKPLVLSDSDTGNHLYPGKNKLEVEHEVNYEPISSSPDNERVRNQKRELEHDVEIKGITQAPDEKIIGHAFKRQKRDDDESPNKEKLKSQKSGMEDDVEIKGIAQASDEKIIVPLSKEHNREYDLAQNEETSDEKDRQAQRVEDNFSENTSKSCTASEIETVIHTNQEETTKGIS